MTRPGLDSPFDEKQMKVGRRLAMKVLNASKFVLGNVGATSLDPVRVTEPIDCALLARLANVIVRGDRRLRRLRLHLRARGDRDVLLGVLRRLPRAGQVRAYAEDESTARESARATLAIALEVQLRLLAPFLPYVTEEVWSWWRSAELGGSSIHLAEWPTVTGLGSAAASNPSMVDAVAAALGGIRGAKSQAKVSMRAELARVEITGPEAAITAVRAAEADLRGSGKIVGDLVFTVSDDAELSVTAELAATE